MVYAEIDMSNQISNSWSKNTVLAIGQGQLRYSVVLDVPGKKLLLDCIEKNTNFKTKNQKDLKKANDKKKRYANRCSSLCHAFLIHLILMNNKDVVTEVRICRDTHPRFIDHYLQNISNHKNSPVKGMKRSFGLPKNNSVQKYAKEILRGDKKPDYVLNNKDVQEMISLIDKFVPKEK